MDNVCHEHRIGFASPADLTAHLLTAHNGRFQPFDSTDWGAHNESTTACCGCTYCWLAWDLNALYVEMVAK